MDKPPKDIRNQKHSHISESPVLSTCNGHISVNSLTSSASTLCLDTKWSRYHGRIDHGGKHDELLSDLPVEWLVQEPQEITSHWLPNEFGINEELI
ncbi:TPA: hypothetical protein ACMDVD_000909 [Vibrio parahaemolyticus]